VQVNRLLRRERGIVEDISQETVKISLVLMSVLLIIRFVVSPLLWLDRLEVAVDAAA